MATPPVVPPAAPRKWQRLLQGWAAVGWVTRIVARLAYFTDPILLRISGDHYSLTSIAIGIPVMLVSTIGARSGAVRTHPLTIIPDGKALGLIASNFGRRHAPGWSHNLRAHGTARVRLGGVWRAFRALEVSGEDRRRLWDRAVALYPGYSDYARRAARPIPVFLLVPSEEPT